jgi:hypothetical protein
MDSVGDVGGLGLAALTAGSCELKRQSLAQQALRRGAS